MANVRKMKREIAKLACIPLEFSVANSGHIRIGLPNGKYVTCSLTPKDQTTAVFEIVRDIKRKMSGRYQ